MTALGLLSMRAAGSTPMFSPLARLVGETALAAVEALGADDGHRAQAAGRARELRIEAAAEVAAVETTLDSSHVPPFDRGDAFALAHALEACVADLEGACDLAVRLPLGEAPAALQQLSIDVARIAAETAETLARLTSARTGRSLGQRWSQVTRLGDRAEQRRRDLVVNAAGGDPGRALVVLEAAAPLADAARRLREAGLLARTMTLKGA